MHNKKLLTFLVLAGFVFFGVAAVSPRAGIKDRNLKVLPKDISDHMLDSIMDSYNKALGEKCNFCHAPFDPKFPDSLNFASDAEPMKEEARKMMRMTIEINRSTFWFNKFQRPEYLNTVSCKTCHRGQPIPD
jgi:hypothetical protein